MKCTRLSLVLFLSASIAGAATLTVGPNRQYARPCPAILAAKPGDTIEIDSNKGIPYHEPPDPTHGNRSDCVWYTNHLTIVGVHGRAILDAAGEIIQEGILVPHGADLVISNLELRNASTQPGHGDNAAGIKIDAGTVNSPAGGNVTIQHCYIHNNQDGILSEDVGPGGPGAPEGDGYPDGEFLYPHPYIRLLHDDVAYNGNNTGRTHNIYIGFDNNHELVFTMKYSWSHDAYVGHVLKTRAPYNNIYYNLIGDALGNSSYILDFPLGGSTYIVGNVFYKARSTNKRGNSAWMFWRDIYDNTSFYPVYGKPHEDLHFINNTVVLDPTTTDPSFVVTACENADFATCPPPRNGPVLTTKEVVENNIFIGPMSEATNQRTAVVSHNLIEANTPANLAALFVDPAHYNYHLRPGAPAIQAGLYPPTDNTGAADPKALATDEYVQPTAGIVRPRPTGSAMDEGAYGYPRARSSVRAHRDSQ